jgi:hypothetical protein
MMGGAGAGAGGLGGLGGLGMMQNPQMMQAMLSNPMVQGMMQQMAQVRAEYKPLLRLAARTPMRAHEPQCFCVSSSAFSES